MQDTTALKAESEAHAKVAAKVPDLVERVGALEGALAKAEGVVAAQAARIPPLEQRVEELALALADAARAQAEAVAVAERPIPLLAARARELEESVRMCAEELGYERRCRLPGLAQALAVEEGLVKQGAERAEMLRKQVEDLKARAAGAARKAEAVQGDLDAVRRDTSAEIKALKAALEEATRPPPPKDERAAETQTEAPATKSTATGFCWARHLEPQEPFELKAVSAQVALRSKAPPGAALLQETVELGREVAVQASVGVAERGCQCELKTEREEELEEELGEALDRAEELEAKGAAVAHELDALRTKQMLVDAEVDDALKDRDAALKLLEDVEQQTRARIDGAWRSKYKLQQVVHKLMMNTQQKMAANLGKHGVPCVSFPSHFPPSFPTRAQIVNSPNSLQPCVCHIARARFSYSSLQRSNDFNVFFS